MMHCYHYVSKRQDCQDCRFKTKYTKILSFISSEVGKHGILTFYLNIDNSSWKKLLLVMVFLWQALRDFQFYPQIVVRMPSKKNIDLNSGISGFPSISCRSVLSIFWYYSLYPSLTFSYRLTNEWLYNLGIPAIETGILGFKPGKTSCIATKTFF